MSRQLLRATLLILSVVLCLGVLLCFALQADGCAAVTLVPPWIWFVIGLGLAALGWKRTRRHFVLAVVGLWLLFLLLFAEELRHVLRSRHQDSLSQDGQTLRVISLNCAGQADAANEVAAHHPDLVLLQEMPGRSAVEKLARQMYGDEAGVLCGADTTILVHGQLTPQTLPMWLRCLKVHVRLTSGIELDVCNVRLSPDAIRLDLWDAQCWVDHAATRRSHRQQLTAILQATSLPGEGPLILGGDFNAPPRDPLYRRLQPRLHDAFQENGFGWGNTLVNECPLWRIDQVWVSEHFRAATVRTQKTQHSDHRMVICDLILRQH